MTDENKPKIDGATHWVLLDHEEIQVAIFKIEQLKLSYAMVRCIWVRKKIKLGYRVKVTYKVNMEDMIRNRSTYPGGPKWRPVGDLEDLFIELKDEQQ